MGKVYCVIFIVYLLFPVGHLSAQENAHGDVVVHGPPGLALLYKRPADKRIIYKREIKYIPKTASTQGNEANPVVKSGVSKKNDAYTPAPHLSSYTRLVSNIRHERTIFSGRGYRVQIYYGPDRGKAMKIKAEFMRVYPDVRTYLSYYPPYFRVKVGNFRYRSDALGMLREANSMYSPSMIVPDIITISTF